ncbi:MAG: hypothetical protein ACLSGP_00365 [Faecalibacterium prausnitzii]
MKMLKKLLAVVLTGAMALTLLTACGGNAVTEKSIADAMNDMAKVGGTNVTFTPQAQERELARKIAALLEGKATDEDSKDAIKKILDYDQGGANAGNFVWWGKAPVDKIGTSGQAFSFWYYTSAQGNAENDSNLTNKTPADDRNMGTALCKMLDDDGNLVTWRVIVVTAKAEEDKDKD